jgi:endogenous inhibitor of DNA gyrase (YacG/DUF329 family)
MTITVECPTCQASVTWLPESKQRPFCSERCKLIDLGAWANEDNNLSTDITPELAFELMNVDDQSY